MKKIKKKNNNPESADTINLVITQVLNISMIYIRYVAKQNMFSLQRLNTELAIINNSIKISSKHNTKTLTEIQKSVFNSQLQVNKNLK